MQFGNIYSSLFWFKNYFPASKLLCSNRVIQWRSETTSLVTFQKDNMNEGFWILYFCVFLDAKWKRMSAEKKRWKLRKETSVCIFFAYVGYKGSRQFLVYTKLYVPDLLTDLIFLQWNVNVTIISNSDQLMKGMHRQSKIWKLNINERYISSSFQLQFFKQSLTLSS